MSAGQIVQVDPAALTIALNVRTDAKVDKEFVATFKELGVLQPPMVVENGAGGYDVVLGQRRVLASVEAGLKEIPVYLVDKSQADAARVVDQLAENEQRQNLTPSEVVGGYKQLALFGLSPAQIAKKVSRPRKAVDLALAVAEDERASQALDEGMTLDQAAVLVEFAEDKAARKKLEDAAVNGRFDHVAAELRAKRELEELIASLQVELEGEKITVLPFTDQRFSKAEIEGKTLTKLEDLGKPGALTESLDLAGVKNRKALAGRVIKDWLKGNNNEYRMWAEKQYFIIDAETNGFEAKVYERDSGPTRELTPEEMAAEAERQARWGQEHAEKEALATAGSVRCMWVKELLQRKTLPADMMAFVASVAAKLHLTSSQDTFEWLGAPLTDEQIRSSDDEDAIEQLTALAVRVGALKFLAAVAFEACEDAMRSGWQRGEVVAWYLPLLVSWGYGLSEAEQGLLVVEDESA